MWKPSKTLIHSSKSRVRGFVKSRKIDKKCFQNLDAVLIRFFNDFELILGSFWGSKIVKKCIKVRFDFCARFWRVFRELTGRELRPRGLPRIPFQGILNRRFIFDLRIRRNEGLPRNRGCFSRNAFGPRAGEFKSSFRRFVALIV